MARMRTIKPSFFTDRRVTKLSFAARLWFEGMWVFALCDAGHLDDDAYELRLKVFPADQVDEDALTDEVLASGMVARKQVPDGRSYLQVVNMAKHQRTDPRFVPRCPYCAHENSWTPRNSPESPAEPTSSHASSRENTGAHEIPHKVGLVGVGIKNLPAPDGADLLLLDVADPEPPPPDAPPPPSTAAAFAAFWDAYPVKRDKPKALKAFERAARRAPAERIVAGARRYRDDPNRDPTKTKYPEGWLNGDRWDDPDLPPPVTPNGFPIQQPTGTSPWDRR
jgi:hypothetical protein